MAGITGSALTRLPVQTVSVEVADGSDDILYRFIRADGERCVANERAIGVAQAESSADGEVVPVIRAGIATVEAGGAIALADGEKAVQTDLKGRALPHQGNNPIVGWAIDAAGAEGALVRVILA